MRSKIIAAFFGCFFLLIVAALFWGFLSGRGELQRETLGEEAIKVPPRISRSAEGETIIKLDPETQALVGLQIETLIAETRGAEILAYGKLQEDPSLIFTLRASLAGIVRLSDSGNWPQLGKHVAAGQPLALLVPRMTPLERLDLSGRLAMARGEISVLEAAGAANEAAVNRARLLNAEGKSVSDRALQEAETRAKSDTARLAAERENVRLLETWMASNDTALSSIPLASNLEGEVVEVFVQPGETVESGQQLLRVARFDHMIARVDVPAGEASAIAPGNARIVVVGFEGPSLIGERIGLAPAIDPRTLGQGYLYRVANSGSKLRPGAAVMAYLPVAGVPQTGVVIPLAAVVRDRGKIWAYLQIGADRFTRREVLEDHRVDRGWFMMLAFRPGDRIVAAGAQVLLSEELKSQIQILEEGEKK
jgi:multidrug efflux pump subunit AcrA (membrane-fusion protein)